MDLHRSPLTAALLAALCLAGCANAEPTPTPEPSPTTAEPSPTPSAAPSEPDDPCLESTSTPMPYPDGAEPIAAAAERVDLPNDLTLLGVQIIESTEQPGMVEAVARICGEPLAQPELVDVATEIAVAAHAEPASESLARLVVTAWAPDAAGTLEPGESVSTDFQLYTWEPSAVPMSTNWD